MHILSPVTDNCSSWISGRGSMAVEIFSWPSLHERMFRTWGSNSGLLACQADTLPIELPRPANPGWEHIGSYSHKSIRYNISECQFHWQTKWKLCSLWTFKRFMPPPKKKPERKVIVSEMWFLINEEIRCFKFYTFTQPNNYFYSGCDR